MKIRNLLLAGLCMYAGCTEKGDQLAEPFIGNYKFTTYTTDTLRLRLLINDEVVTDSLITPIGSVVKQINFTTDSLARLRVINTSNNIQFIDTMIRLKIGQSTISIVQLTSGQHLHIPSAPNEPAPAPGNCKVRFQYVQPTNAAVPFFDSVRCFIRKTSSGSVPFDTIVLYKYQLSKFFEGNIGDRFSIIIKDPLTGDPIHNGSSAFINTSGYPDFNTAILFGTGGIPGTYSFRINRIY